MNSTIKLTIDNQEVRATQDQILLKVAHEAGIYIPNLCFHPDLGATGSCRLCIVQIEGVRGLTTACTVKVTDGMVVTTINEQIKELRQNIVWLLLSEYKGDINAESESEFKKVVDFIGIKDFKVVPVKAEKKFPVSDLEPLFLRDPNLCILCGRCTGICQQIRGVGAIGFIGRGIDTVVGTSFGEGIKEAGCRFCGACVEVCPTGALKDKHKFTEKNKKEKLVPCENTCPAGIDIPRYVGLIAQGKFQDALEVIRTKVPFPHSLGCVCDHPCEEECRRNDVCGAISIKALKKIAASKDNGRWKDKLIIKSGTGKKVAIVGAGPAGLTAAYFLRLKGYAVTVFESLAEAGGMMRTGIPKYRLPRNILNQEIKDIVDLGVIIKLNSPVDSVDALKKAGFEAVFIAVGAPGGMRMGIPGENNGMVLDGISFLKSVNLGETGKIFGTVVVVGGGNVAMDVARTAIRLGAVKVIVLYRRTRSEMPANNEEIEEALEEGIEFNFLTAPQKVIGQGVDKIAIECIKMELGAPDDSGRRRPVEVAGSEFLLEANSLISAIGQEPTVPADFLVKLDRKGYIVVDEAKLSTSVDGVFAGGDIVSGPASVIKAINAGRVAAGSIDICLGGDGGVEQELVPEAGKLVDDSYIGRVDGFAFTERVKIALVEAKERVKNFDPVEGVLSEKEAQCEAQKCLKCQLRLQISKPLLPPG